MAIDALTGSGKGRASYHRQFDLGVLPQQVRLMRIALTFRDGLHD